MIFDVPLHQSLNRVSSDESFVALLPDHSRLISGGDCPTRELLLHGRSRYPTIDRQRTRVSALHERGTKVMSQVDYAF
jgi:hypothetical protein